MTIRRSISTLLIAVIAVATLSTLAEIPAQTGAAGPNDHVGEQAGAEEDVIPQMNEEDLRQVVIALAAEVESLRKRVETLERQDR